jgi:dTDP-4-dehydrorhamnose reductase
MNILVLGATGMLGHKLMQGLSHRFKVIGSVRDLSIKYADHPILGKLSLLGGVHVENFDSIVEALARSRPAVLVNCIGIVKQAVADHDPFHSITVNAHFPHRLAHLCQASGVRLIHISTDCVFSGRKGNYVESDVADAEDLYGRTKLLGEIDYTGVLTLRTSMIGRELETSQGLIEWFLSQKSRVTGYKRAIFSGFTTEALTDIIANIIIEYPDMRGIWHVASEPISKFDLLSLVKKIYGLKIQINIDEQVVCNRSLNADRFKKLTGFVPPLWPEMVDRMYRDPTPYSDIRRSYVD